MFLFIDTTEKLTLGLVNRDYSWLEFKRFDLKSISSQIHKYIFEMLQKFDLNLNNLDGLIYCAGPGSYTGMRVSEGLASILEWQDLKLFNFYHFEIPKLAGIVEGMWLSKAFKNEMFLYEWNQSSDSKHLINEDDFKIESKEKGFARMEMASKYSIESSDKILEENPQEILKKIVDRNSKQEIFYYRSLDQEFSKQ